MRNLKKILALVLALVMSLSLMATAGAASFPDVADDNAYKTAIEVLNGVEVLQGYDNGARFEPKGAITRAEAAAVIYRIATGDVNDTQKDIYTAWNGAGKLSDVSGWYAGYVNYCCNAGYIKGYPNGTFQAQNNVTGYEVLAMVLRAMGYGRNGEFSGSQWAITVGSLAQTLGITKNITETLGEPATREMVAEIVFRAIFCETQMYNALHLYEGTGTNLAANLSLEEVEGVVIANEYADLYDTDTLADGKTMVREGDKTYTINYGTTLDDIGESRMIYIQNKTDVISLADSGHNVKDETTEKMKLGDLLGRVGISQSDAETYLNFGQGTNWHSDWKIRYEISLNTKVEEAAKGDPIPEVDLNAAIAALLDDDEYDGFVLPSTYKTGNSENYELKTRTEDSKNYYTLVYTVPFRIDESIGSNDQKNIIEIFNIADRKGTDTENAYVTGEVYVGTTSMKDISDTKSLAQFKEEYIIEDEAASVSANERGNWLKVIDNDADGKADYILKVIYTFAQVSRVKDDKVTLDVKDHTLSTATGKDCATDAVNNLTSQKVVSADELALDDVVYYAIIDGKAQTYKAAMETATFDKVNHNTLVATTTENVDWTESEVHEHIEDEAFMSGVENIAGKVSYDCYFDRGGYLGVLVKTDKTSDFKLIVDGWFYQAKNGAEYAAKVYNDETKKIETVDITENGSLFISGKVTGVDNNDWGALKFLGNADESAKGGALDDLIGDSFSYSTAALNGGFINSTKTSVERNNIHTAVAAITADGTILPVENSAVSGRYNHAMLDIPDLTDVPTKNPVTGTVYYTKEARATDTAYDTKYTVSDYDVYALDNTVYYVVYPATVGGTQVVRTVGYANAPDMDSLNEQGIVEDIYAVGTYRERENDLRADYFTADVVVVELSAEPENMGEIVLVVDDVTRSLNVRYRDIVVINEEGKREERRVDWSNNTMAYSDNVSGGKKILPGLYRMAAKDDDLWYISDLLTPEEIRDAGCFDAGYIVKHQWVGQKWIEIAQASRVWNDETDEYDWYENGKDVRYTVPSTEETPLWYLAYGDSGYDEASLSDTEGHDFVLQAQANDRTNNKSYEPYRETYWYDGHNTHYYNYNKVLLRLDSKGNVVYAVSFENEYKDKSKVKDFAYTVFWESVVPAAEDEAATYTVKVEDTEFATNKQGSEKFTIAAYDKNTVGTFKDGVWTTEAPEGARITIKAPRGFQFAANTVTATGATVKGYTDKDGNVFFELTEIKNENIVIKVTLTEKADDKWTVKVYDDEDATDVSTKLEVTDPDDGKLALNTALLDKSITIAKKTALAEGETYEVTAIYIGSEKLTEGVTEDYTYSATTGKITFNRNATLDGDIRIEAKTNPRGANRIVEVQGPAPKNQKMALGDTALRIVGAEGDAKMIKDGWTDGDGLYKFQVAYGTPLVILVKTEATSADLHVTGDDVTPTVTDGETMKITVPDANGEAVQKVEIADIATVADKQTGKTLTEVQLGENAAVKDAVGGATVEDATAVEATVKYSDKDKALKLTASKKSTIDVWFAEGDEPVVSDDTKITAANTKGDEATTASVTVSGAGVYTVRVTAEDGTMQYYVINMSYADDNIALKTQSIAGKAQTAESAAEAAAKNAVKVTLTNEEATDAALAFAPESESAKVTIKVFDAGTTDFGTGGTEKTDKATFTNGQFLLVTVESPKDDAENKATAYYLYEITVQGALSAETATIYGVDVSKALGAPLTAVTDTTTGVAVDLKDAKGEKKGITLTAVDGYDATIYALKAADGVDVSKLSALEGDDALNNATVGEGTDAIVKVLVTVAPTDADEGDTNIVYYLFNITDSTPAGDGN